MFKRLVLTDSEFPKFKLNGSRNNRQKTELAGAKVSIIADAIKGAILVLLSMIFISSLLINYVLIDENVKRNKIELASFETPVEAPRLFKATPVPPVPVKTVADAPPIKTPSSRYDKLGLVCPMHPNVNYANELVVLNITTIGNISDPKEKLLLFFGDSKGVWIKDIAVITKESFFRANPIAIEARVGHLKPGSYTLNVKNYHTHEIEYVVPITY